MTRLLLTLVACLAIGSTAALHAHPTATTSVTITITDDRAVVTFISDGRSLAMMLDALETTVTDASVLTQDGVRVALTHLRTDAIGDQSNRVAVYLTAPLSGGTDTAISWRTKLVIGAYPLIVQRGTATTTFEADDDVPVAEWLNGPQESRPIVLRDVEHGGAAHWSLIWIGLTHIVPKGLDHILFVAGLFLLARRSGELIAQITTFTLAHSVTLGLAAAGLVSLPAAVVEPLIALSIVYLAVEHFAAVPLTRWRLLVVFAFGLLHGLGFAEALTSLLPATADLLPSLLAFNVGVELGQLVVVAAMSILIFVVRATGADARSFVARPAAIVLAGTGIFWTIERVVF